MKTIELELPDELKADNQELKTELDEIAILLHVQYFKLWQVLVQITVLE